MEELSRVCLTVTSLNPFCDKIEKSNRGCCKVIQSDDGAAPSFLYIRRQAFALSLQADECLNGSSSSGASLFPG